MSLFFCRARSALACLLLVQNDKEAAKNLRMYIPAYKLDLFFLLTKLERRSEFYKLFLHELSSSSELKQMLQKLYSVQTSCTENQKASVKPTFSCPIFFLLLCVLKIVNSPLNVSPCRKKSSLSGRSLLEWIIKISCRDFFFI